MILFLHYGTQEVVSKESWVSVMAVESGRHYIKCFAGACKMNSEIAGAVTEFQNLVHEAFPLAPDHYILIRFEEAVRIQLDKLPVRPTGDPNASASPTIPPSQ